MRGTQRCRYHLLFGLRIRARYQTSFRELLTILLKKVRHLIDWQRSPVTWFQATRIGLTLPQSADSGSACL